MLRIALTAVACLMLSSLCRAEEEMIFDANACASTEAARKMWTPIHEGTPPVDVANVGGKRSLELPCSFTTNEQWRVCWDLKGKWDLADMTALVVDVRTEVDRGERMTLYFHTRGGWFRHVFAVPPGGGAIILPRDRFQTEDAPANWYEIDTLRLAVARGDGVDRKVRVAAIRLVRSPLRAALYRGKRTAAGTLRRAMAALDRLGLPFEIVADEDVAAGRLHGKTIVLHLPGPPPSPAISEAFKQFVAAGGSVISLGDAHIAPDNRRLLAEDIAKSWPGLWQDLYDLSARNFGTLAGCADIDEIEQLIRTQANDDAKRLERASALLDAARKLRLAAGQANAEGKAKDAFEGIAKADDLCERALFTSVASRTPEFRAVWCHKPTGVDGMTWDEAMKTLADSGFNALIVNMSWGFGAAYPSDLLPLAESAQGKDQLAICIEAARKHGIEVHVWRVNWNLASSASKEIREKLRAEGRLQEEAKGEPVDWLCPSNPLNRRLEIDAMVEVARKYDVAGIHFDYIRYPGRGSCYCPRCREGFEKEYGLKVADWPADVRTGALRDRYFQYRRDTVSPVVEAVSKQAHTIKPDIQVSAAVFWEWTSARDDVGQDWKMWVEKGWLDFVCPMQYTTDAAQFEHMTKLTGGWVDGRIPLFPGIGATLRQSPDDTLLQILTVRNAGAPGFVLFGYYPPLAADHLPLLRLGPTSRKATYAFPRKER